MSQKVNTEWRNARLGCKHDVHRVYVHPITWDAFCSSLEEKVELLIGLQPLFFRQSVDEKKCSSSNWCPSFSTSLSKNPQGIEYLDPR
jgi:hypothetical protein